MARAPLVLIVSEHEWASRSLDTVLAPRGYAVLRAYNGQQALERAAETDPHAVFIDRSLPDTSGLELCQTLRDHPGFSPITPVLLMTAGPVSHDQRVEALRAGAWELITFPVDAEELVLRLDRYIRAKVEADRARAETLVDPETGFYSRNGTIKRIQELGAAAARFGRPIACVVVTAEQLAQASTEHESDSVGDMARLLRLETRKSDVLGRLGPRDFAVVAPDTPPEGAEKLAERIRTRTSTGGATAPRTRTGVYGLKDFTGVEFNPLDFVTRATRATEKPPPHQN